MSTNDRGEGLVQLLYGALIVAFFAALYFGKSWLNWLDLPTPFGLAVRDVAILAFDGLGLLAIIWTSFSPLQGRNAWFGASNMFFMSLWQLPVLTERVHPHPRIVVICGIVVLAAAAAGGLSILARRRWGAR